MAWHGMTVKGKEEEDDDDEILHLNDRNFFYQNKKKLFGFFLFIVFLASSSKEANDKNAELSEQFKTKLILKYTRRRIINTIVLRAILHNVKHTGLHLSEWVSSDHADLHTTPKKLTVTLQWKWLHLGYDIAGGQNAQRL